MARNERSTTFIFKVWHVNQDVPQDHSFFSTQYKFAKKNNIKAVISGGNLATESVFPNDWHNSALDAISIKDIQKDMDH